MLRQTSRHSLTRIVAAAAMLATSVGVVAGSNVANVAADELENPHGQVVPETPRTNMPVILDGRVYASAIVGSRIVVGGTFTQIELNNGSVVTQRYLAAWDVDSGEFDHSFRPVLNKSVRSLYPGDDPDTVFVGGKFSSWDGSPRHHIAKVDLATSDLVPGWNAAVNGNVKTIDRHGDRLFIGGGFSDVSGHSRDNLAELSAASGSVAGFDIGVTGSKACGTRADGLFYCVGGVVTRSVDITPNGDKLVVTHRGTHVGGHVRTAAAIVDISGNNPSVTSWSTNMWANFPVWIVEAELSPDGSYFAMTNIVGNFPPHNDTVVAFPVNGGANTDPLWVTQMFDSVYGIGISDTAVYVGGHFCWTEGPNAPATPWNSWPGSAGNQYSCDSIGGGVFANTVYRYHLAALSPTTGLALDWNPGTNSFNGARSMVVTDRGLLIGFDNDRVNDIRTGRLAFMDLGGGGGGGGGPACAATANADGSIDLVWTGIVDNSYSVRRDGSWLATTGATSYNDSDVTPGPHSYIVRWFAGGSQHNVTCAPNPVVALGDAPGGVTCDVTPIAGGVNLTWTDVDNSYSVRRDGSWLASTGENTYTDTNAPPGPHTYAVRWSKQGVKSEVVCQ